MLTDDDRRVLLAIARDAVQSAAEGRDPAGPPALSPVLQAPGAAFVTLRLRGELRGCIGNLHAFQPLWQSVQRMGRAAALDDDRFDPVRAAEATELSIEISALTPMRRIAGPREIQVGRDGLYVRSSTHSGLLLPQVATEHGWEAEEFLDQTCCKARLPPDAWRSGALELYAFGAEVFSE